MTQRCGPWKKGCPDLESHVQGATLRVRANFLQSRTRLGKMSRTGGAGDMHSSGWELWADTTTSKSVSLSIGKQPWKGSLPVPRTDPVESWRTSIH